MKFGHKPWTNVFWCFLVNFRKTNQFGHKTWRNEKQLKYTFPHKLRTDFPSGTSVSLVCLPRKKLEVGKFATIANFPTLEKFRVFWQIFGKCFLYLAFSNSITVLGLVFFSLVVNQRNTRPTSKTLVVVCVETCNFAGFCLFTFCDQILSFLYN